MRLASGKKILLRLFIQLFIPVFRLYQHTKIRLISAEPFPDSVSICDGGFHVSPSVTYLPAHNDYKIGYGCRKRESNSVPITNSNTRDPVISDPDCCGGDATPGTPCCSPLNRSFGAELIIGFSRHFFNNLIIIY